MKRISIINIKPPKREIVIGNIKFTSQIGIDGTEISSFPMRCVEFFATAFSGNPTNWKDGDINSNIDPHQTRWTIIQNDEKYITNNFIQDLILFINEDFELINQRPESEPTIRDLDEEFLSKMKNILEICRKKKNLKIQISLNRLMTSFTRSEPLDGVLDLCSSIEAFYGISDELRLRISLITFQLLKSKSCMENMYEMYGIRNDFIHGNSIPNITPDQLEKYQKTVIEILKFPVKTGKMPDIGELNSNIIKTIPNIPIDNFT